MTNPENKKTTKQVTEEQLKDIVKQLSEKNQSFWQQLIQYIFWLLIIVIMFGSVAGTIVITTWWDIEYKKELEKGRALKKVNGRWVGK